MYPCRHVGPVEQFAGRCGAERFEHAADAGTGGWDGPGLPPFVNSLGVQRGLAMHGELQGQEPHPKRTRDRTWNRIRTRGPDGPRT